MIKMLCIIIISTGILLVGTSGYQIYKTIGMNEKSLTEAYSMLEASTGRLDKKRDMEEFNPQQGDTVGILTIPKLEAELPIVEGTSEDELEKGVGHYKGTAFPSQKDQIVLSGHRDTVFQRMGEIEVGDILIVRLPYGNFEYKVESTKIVDADDRTIIKSTAPTEELVVTTCYPFTFIGSAPSRYILTAKPIPNN